MCGISGAFGQRGCEEKVKAMARTQRHRGPDHEGFWIAADDSAALAHNRLSILDLSEAGNQPMSSADGALHIVFNGEIYNFIELKRELPEFSFRSQSDTEVLLAAYQKWGAGCLDRLNGMFAFLIWDESRKRLFAARDRFGVKPLYLAEAPGGGLLAASEIKALHAAGVEKRFDERAWSSYLVSGVQDHPERTFWNSVRPLPAGHWLTWSASEGMRNERWYDVAERSGEEIDRRDSSIVEEEYSALLLDSVKLRFRSDVPVGINLSGGLDSSILLSAVHGVQGADSDVKAFTFATGDERYDELPWVKKMLERTNHPSVVSMLRAEDTPALAEQMQTNQDEPFGGLPTIAYAKLFARAREEGVIVLLDGQGMDEQWAGYDYYRRPAANGAKASIVQGSTDSPLRPDCVRPELRRLACEGQAREPYTDRLRNLQYRDLTTTKIPRALRFNDRASMKAATELREPFLDHRLVELALRQPAERKIGEGCGKKLLRKIASERLPRKLVEAPKRPLQTPQREWLRGPLRDWALAWIRTASDRTDLLERDAVGKSWQQFLDGRSDNSFYVWQWISLGMMSERGA